jgi:hypothetical protein
VTTSALSQPAGFVSELVEPPTRVYVRRPPGHAGIAVEGIGYITHRRRLGPMTVSCTVRLPNQVELDCPLSWTKPTVDWTALLRLPTGEP